MQLGRIFDSTADMKNRFDHASVPCDGAVDIGEESLAFVNTRGKRGRLNRCQVYQRLASLRQSLADQLDIGLVRLQFAGVDAPRDVDQHVAHRGQSAG